MDRRLRRTSTVDVAKRFARVRGRTILHGIDDTEQVFRCPVRRVSRCVSRRRRRRRRSPRRRARGGAGAGSAIAPRSITQRSASSATVVHSMSSARTFFSSCSRAASHDLAAGGSRLVNAARRAAPTASFSRGRSLRSSPRRSFTPGPSAPASAPPASGRRARMVPGRRGAFADIAGDIGGDEPSPRRERRLGIVVAVGPHRPPQDLALAHELLADASQRRDRFELGCVATAVGMQADQRHLHERQHLELGLAQRMSTWRGGRPATRVGTRRSHGRARAAHVRSRRPDAGRHVRARRR